ncbi:50S ribosomal protein L11 methyltransferase [Aquisalibacillus elongatus]|uniref:Ribosomal protein L11 methyltransferase n=1 Tax=Aquisalibacillus elongatus TaxID=485577 RepID=A0A3N5BDM3_9BACI|nr:50S ribosomal protein L11 methyltransferase [Aquisalibacillus elongatus]RPF55583.1 [LSU ribosomal protein L11P]-lysine N-methyltransferase [Aquisalibacillus elongatus]
MKWSELKVHTTNEAIEPISNILHESGASGVVIEDPQDLHKLDDVTLFGTIYELDPSDYPDEGVYVKAYLPVNSFLGETVDEIKQAISNLDKYDIDIGKNNVTISEVNEEEWATAWKKYYKPVKISEKITIIPTWEEYTPVSSDEIIIELDPGMAFGTGTHPTTVLSIQALEQYVKEGDVIYDVGSGSGVLSIAAALLGAKRIKAFDLDEIAVKSTTINVKLNRVQDQVEAQHNNLLENVELGADLIVSNILAEIIVQFVDEAYEKVNAGGYFITSGIIQGKKDLVKEKLTQAGFKILEVNQMEDWISIVAQKPE